MPSHSRLRRDSPSRQLIAGSELQTTIPPSLGETEIPSLDGADRDRAAPHSRFAYFMFFLVFFPILFSVIFFFAFFPILFEAVFVFFHFRLESHTQNGVSCKAKLHGLFAATPDEVPQTFAYLL